MPSPATREAVATAEMHPAYRALLERLTPPEPPNGRAPRPGKAAELAAAQAANLAVAQRHHPVAVGAYVLCGGCANVARPVVQELSRADVVVPCGTVLDICGPYGLELDWPAANAEFLAAVGRPAGRALVNTSVDREDTPIYDGLREPTLASDEQETPT
jgi:hypothetical protein